MTVFRGVDLAALGVPEEALPVKDFPYKGQKGYTVYSQNGAVT